MIDYQFWRGKRVFLTGHTGFKGSWLSLMLTSLGSEVRGYALDSPTNPSLFKEAKVSSKIESTIGDIRDQKKLSESMASFNPEILIHLAAQPLVRLSYSIPIETYDVNVMGTAKVLESARSCSNLKAIINVTSDKCYRNDEKDDGYNENSPLGGYDPYSNSKSCAEMVTSSYRSSFFYENKVGLASARAGNVIGGGDWAEDRLIPDILRSFTNEIPVRIRNPDSIRPWQHVLESLTGYLLLGQKLYSDHSSYSEGWNFGPNQMDMKPVEYILQKMISKWPKSIWIHDKTFNAPEAKTLKLNTLKAKTRLGWNPTWSLDKTLDKIIYWHQAWLGGEDMHDYCLEEIKEFIRDNNHENN